MYRIDVSVYGAVVGILVSSSFNIKNEESDGDLEQRS